MTRRLLIILASLVLAATGHGCADAAYAQAVGATGRTTSSGTSTSTSTFSLTALGTITCSGMTCSYTSGTISPSSQVVSGTLAFNSTHDASMTIGGTSGGGTGQVQVSCDGGSTWNAIAIGSGSVGSAVSYTYPTPHCTGVTNLNTLEFREFLGGGGTTGFTMALTSPSQVTISW
jgi:hypothetical protein